MATAASSLRSRCAPSDCLCHTQINGSQMHRKHTGEFHKAAICGARFVRETLVFQHPRIARRAKKRPFMELSSMFAQFDRGGRAKWFTSNDLTTGPPAQSAIQNSIDLRHRHRPLRGAAE